MKDCEFYEIENLSSIGVCIHLLRSNSNVHPVSMKMCK